MFRSESLKCDHNIFRQKVMKTWSLNEKEIQKAANLELSVYIIANFIILFFISFCFYQSDIKVNKMFMLVLNFIVLLEGQTGSVCRRCHEFKQTFILLSQYKICIPWKNVLIDEVKNNFFYTYEWGKYRVNNNMIRIHGSFTFRLPYCTKILPMVSVWKLSKSITVYYVFHFHIDF